MGYLKAGIHFADAITTVSPTYAQEIRTLRGMGLDAHARRRERALSGIVNGIDTEVWIPATDPHLAQALRRRERRGPRGEQACGRAALRTAGRRRPVIGMVTRLTAQKGIDLVAATLDATVASRGATGRARHRRRGA